MERNGLTRRLGWLSVGLGLTDLVFAETLCRPFALGRRAWLVRLAGVRELVTGMGLLLAPRPRPWLLARVAGDAVDLSVMGSMLGRSWRPKPVQLATLAGAVGLTLLDVFAATERAPEAVRTPRRAADLEPLPYAPAESWRGSGLAEDVGGAPTVRDSPEDEAAREQRMREAQEQLGLPDPDTRIAHL